MIEELIEIIKKLKGKITDDSDMVWTGYETSKQLRDELEAYILELQAGNATSMEKIKTLLLPTGALQEHSISNRWGDEFLDLSEKFDHLYMRIKHQN
ncbi:MAG TPA: hypothetical protein VGQ53_10900 [Chitinophagaceae bacterium]|jgi:hypothetical protein|nr:hypothetical protein [Chitinophagaceae bacterium]